jgi:multiple antibiotic resistance protein
LFVGSYILKFFDITLESLKIAGGMIIVSSGFALLTGSFTNHKGMRENVRKDAEMRSDISLTPLAIPMLAGPGTISLLITYEHEFPVIADRLILLAALISLSFLLFLILRTSHYIVKKLGASGINALSRIIGFLVIAIGVEYFLSALFVLVEKMSS